MADAENNPNADEAFTFSDDGSFNLPDGTKVGTQQELGEGWMRQADYTRKTQDLAIQRREVETASNLMNQLEQNPAGTLKALAENLGVDLYPTATPVAQAPERQSDGWDDNSWDDEATQATPSTQEDPRIQSLLDAVSSLQAQVGSVAGTQARSTVETELANVTGQYAEAGIEVEPNMLVRYARENDLNDLGVAAKLLYHEDIVAVEAAKLAGDEAVTADKRAASQAITPGTGLAGDSPPSSSGSDEKMSIRESIEASLVEHGVSDLRDLKFAS